MEVLQHLSRGQANIRASQQSEVGQDREDLAALIGMIQMQDEQGLRNELQKNLMQEGVQRFVQNLVAPLTARVGEAWAQGDLAIHEEHMFTECVSRVLRQAVLTITRPEDAQGPRVLLTTFPQEEHGLGLLMVESLLTLQGCRCVSLGTQTPLREIAQAAIAHSSDVVALSFSVSMNANHVVDGLKELNLLLPASVEVWAGGGASALRRRAIDRVRVIDDLAALTDAVQEWRGRQPSSETKNHDWT
jgi:methanogenic corrinoid protein MtbC1